MGTPHPKLPHLTEQDIQRFHAKYVCGIKPDDCHEWIGEISDGYGRLTICSSPQSTGDYVHGSNGRFVSIGGPKAMRSSPRAHRIAYFLHYGEDPGALLVCHKCDNPICVNPRHLFLGDVAVNMKDRNQKQRQARGSRSGAAILTEDLVIEIRGRLADLQHLPLKHACQEVASHFSLVWYTVKDIAIRRTWKHL